MTNTSKKTENEFVKCKKIQERKNDDTDRVSFAENNVTSPSWVSDNVIHGIKTKATENPRHSMSKHKSKLCEAKCTVLKVCLFNVITNGF